jgi:hypothetical protein
MDTIHVYKIIMKTQIFCYFCFTKCGKMDHHKDEKIIEKLPCSRAKDMTKPFQLGAGIPVENFPGIFTFSPEDVCAMFNIKSARGLRIYLGINDGSTGYRRHRAIAVPTELVISPDGEKHLDIINDVKTIIREMSFPCPDMCGNMVDENSPFYAGVDDDPTTCEQAKRMVTLFREDERFTKVQFPRIFSFNYADVHALFGEITIRSFRVYFGIDEKSTGYDMYRLIAVPTEPNEDTMIYEDVVTDAEVVISEASYPNTGGCVDYVDTLSPLFFYDGDRPGRRTCNTGQLSTGSNHVD